MSGIIGGADRFLGVRLKAYEDYRARLARQARELKVAHDWVYACSECENQQFVLCCNGDIQCVKCGSYQTGLYCWEPDDLRR